MHSRVKALAAAVALVAGGALMSSAHARISDDGFGGGIATGDGSGDLFFSIIDEARNESLALDLGLTANDFRDGAIGFSVTDPALASFIAGSPDAGNMRWNIGALSNKADPTSVADFGFLTTNRDPINPANAPQDISTLTAAMGNAANFIAALNFWGIEAPDGPDIDQDTASTSVGSVLVDNPAATAFHNGGLWGNSFGGSFTGGFSNEGNIDDALAMSFVATGNSAMITAFSGVWKLDPETGTVSFVPIPAAVWLFGSAAVALAGIARRRRTREESLAAA